LVGVSTFARLTSLCFESAAATPGEAAALTVLRTVVAGLRAAVLVVVVFVGISVSEKILGHAGS
jgi:hypothetical protein